MLVDKNGEVAKYIMEKKLTFVSAPKITNRPVQRERTAKEKKKKNGCTDWFGKKRLTMINASFLLRRGTGKRFSCLCGSGGLAIGNSKLGLHSLAAACKNVIHVKKGNRKKV